MLSPFEFLSDMANPMLDFLPRALFVALVSAVVCALVGTHVVLRGMAFIGDAVAHAVFPGLAIAFALGGSLLIGGVVAGVATAVAVALLSQFRRLAEDTVIGVLFAAAFALGIVVMALTPGYAGNLHNFLLGSLTAVPSSDLPWIVGASLVVVAVLMVLHRHIVTVAIDRETAQAAGLNLVVLDIVLYACVAVAVVVSVNTIGSILVIALLITPAATARLLVDHMVPMMIVGPTIGAVASLVGVYVSWSLDVPAGATIVLVLTVFFGVAWVAAPRHGLIARRRRRLVDLRA